MLCTSKVVPPCEPNIFHNRWTDASPKVSHPEQWGDHLAAQALASERWIDSRWQLLL